MPCENCDFFHFSDFFSDFLATFSATFLATFSAGSSCTLWVAVKLKLLHVVEAGKAKSRS